MNWDWDKLQEKRQRQNWGNSNNNSNNNNNNNKNDEELPFGSGSGNGGGKGPDYEKFSDAFKRLPHLSAPAGGKVKWILVALVAVWLLSGIYIVNPDEEGVVLRFGKYDRTVGARPALRAAFSHRNRLQAQSHASPACGSGLPLRRAGPHLPAGGATFPARRVRYATGDENIVNVQFSVQYQIKNPVEYLFNVTDQAAVVKNAAEAAMREVIGNSLIDSALTDGKLRIQTEATQLLQETLEPLQGRACASLAVQLQDVHPPKEVSDAFKDVASAREDKSRIINEAEAYRNELIPKARGLAAEVENQAQAYKETRIRNAEGEANRFLALLKEYEQAKDVTKQRMYLETMEEILSRPGMEKLVLPKDAADRVLPLLPLMQSAPSAGKVAPQEQSSGTQLPEATLSRPRGNN